MYAIVLLPQSPVQWRKNEAPDIIVQRLIAIISPL
jgi:hypothetical protein